MEPINVFYATYSLSDSILSIRSLNTGLIYTLSKSILLKHFAKICKRCSKGLCLLITTTLSVDGTYYLRIEGESSAAKTSTYNITVAPEG